MEQPALGQAVRDAPPPSRIASIVARHGAAASESAGMTVSSNTHHTPHTGHANA